VGALGYETFDLWLLGQTGAAIASSDRELDLARSLDHPFSLTYALTFAAWFHRMRGDIDRCLRLAQEVHQLSTARDVAVYRAVGILLSGSALVEQGQLREGLDLLERGMADYRQTGSSVILPYWEGLHADALRRCGRFDEAQAALERGLQAVESTGERWCEAELYRYRAVLLAATDAPQAQVVSAFEKAIETARGQGAKAWELRATLDLARHRPGLARDPDALAGLQALRNGFDLRSVGPELQELDALIVGAR
jgi:predicted ATPase